MGCFSWLCSECGKGVTSTSFQGEQVKLFLIKEGKIVDQMEGEYNSYGSVFIDGTQDPDVKHKLRLSREWKNPTPEEEPDEFWKKQGEAELAWFRICDLMFDDKGTDGIVAIHTKCFKGSVPAVRSKNDPNQGWGENGELFGDISGSGIEE